MMEWSANFPPTEDDELKGLSFTGTKTLRQLTLRMAFYEASNFQPDVLLEALSTITSPVFREFVLEIDQISSVSWFSWPSLERWGRWEEVDRFLGERFAERGDFKVVIRTGKSCHPESFQRYAAESFPLLAGRGRVHFETSHD
jgi:hypothetical protein